MNMINPAYFNFEMMRTKYSSGGPANEFIWAAILLGFYLEVANKLQEDTDRIKLQLLFMKDSEISKIMNDLRLKADRVVE